MKISLSDFFNIPENFNPFDYFSSLDYRIKVIVGIAFGFFLGALAMTLKNRLFSKRIKTIQNSYPQKLRADSSSVSKEKSSSIIATPVAKSSFRSRKSMRSRVSRVGNVKSVNPIEESSLSIQESKVISICYKNILSERGVVTPLFMDSFARQTGLNIQNRVTLNHYDISKTPLSEVSGYRVLLYFMNYERSLKPEEVNQALAREKKEFASESDLALLVLTKLDRDINVQGLDKIQHEKFISDIKGVDRAPKNNPNISPNKNLRTARNIGTLITQKFKVG